MKKKRSTRLTVSLADIFISLVCLVGMVYFFFLFWKDINVTFSRANEEPIAVIYFKKNIAQRKLVDSNIWERLRTSTPIYNGDKIRTAEMSEAYTIFNDCSKIDIHENSLVQIFSKKDKNSVEFLTGTISVLSIKQDGSEGINIQTGNKILKFTENTSAVISISPKDVNQAIITVTSGSVQLEEKIQKLSNNNFLSDYLPDVQSFIPQKSTPILTIDAGNCVSFVPLELPSELAKENNVVKPSELYKDFAVTMPTSSYSLPLNTGKTQYVPFFWSGSKEIQVDFATDASFKNIINSKHLISNSGRSSISFDFAKEYETIFWRAYPVFEIQENLQMENINVSEGIIFIPKKEEINLIGSMKEAFSTKNVELMEQQILTNEEESSNNLLEIIITEEKAAQEENVLEITITNEPITIPKETEENIIQEELVEEKVEEIVEKPADKPVAKLVEKPAKEKQEIVKQAEPQVVQEVVQTPVEKVPEIVSAIPVLLLPEKESIFTEDYFLVDDPMLEFTWNSVKEAENYTFEIIDGNGKNIFKETVETTSIILKDENLSIFDNGSYKWSVTANQSVEGKNYCSKTAQSIFVINLSEIESSEVDTSVLIQ